MRTRTRLLLTGVAITVVAGAPAGLRATLAAPSGTSIPFAPHGDAVDGTSGQPIALSPTSLLVGAEGPDGTPGTSDDETLLVTGIGGTPTVTALATGHASTQASRIERLSATRAALVSAGADGTFGTADDLVLVLDRLGSENVVTPVPVAGLGDSQQYTPERLRSDLFVVPSLGADLKADTADDEVVVVSTAVSPPAVQRLPAPFLRSGGRTRIVAASPTVFFVASDGPDAKQSNGDDVVHMFVATGNVFTRTSLAAPGLNRRAAGRSVRLDPTHALVVSAGPDFKDSTADDEVLLLDAVAATVTHINVPYARSGSSAQPTVLGPSLAVVSTMGADGLPGTADDAVAVLSSIGPATVVTPVVVGAAGDDNESRPARLDASTCALVTYGADATPGTADDAITVIHDAGGTPLVQNIVVGAVAGGTTSTVVPISTGSLLVAGGGPDQTLGTSDDAVTVLTGIGGALAVRRVPLGGAFDAPDAFRFVPTVLGGGRVALLSSGPDLNLGVGDDDAVRVIDGLDLGASLVIRRLDVQFARTRPTRPSRVVVEATLTLPDPSALLGEDVTLSVGNVSQTIAAGEFATARRGRVLTYSDRTGKNGIVRTIAFDTRRRTLRIDARGGDQDLETTAPAYVPIGLEIGATLVPATVSARPRRNGFVYRKRGAGR